MRASLIAAIVSGGLACGGAREPAVRNTGAGPATGARTTLAESPQGRAEVDCGSEEGGDSPSVAEVAPLLVDIWRQERRQEDPNRTFRALVQAVPKGFSGIPETRAGPFPGVSVAEVWGFTFGRTQDLEEGAGDRPCEVISPNGTLCPGVNAPGARLAPEQAKALIELLRAGARPNPRARMHCFDPHLAFVFFDAGHRPVGELDVCLDCNGWTVAPDIPRLSGGLEPHEWKFIVDLCEAVGLDGCWRGDPRFEEAERQYEKSPERFASAWDAAAGPAPLVDVDGAVQTATLAERRALCAQTVRSAWFRGWRSFACPDGRMWEKITYARCVAEFPLCQVKIRDVMECEALLSNPERYCTLQMDLTPCAKIDRCAFSFRPLAMDAGAPHDRSDGAADAADRR